MKSRKKASLMAILLVTVSMVFLAACSGGGSSTTINGEEQIVWKLNHIRPTDTRTDKSAKKFAADVEEATEGRLKIEVYPNAELGDYQLVQESVSMGEIEMQLASMGTNVDPTLQIAIAPYLVSNWEEAKEMYNSEDGLINKYLTDQLNKQNIKLLAVYPQYFGSVFLAKEPNDPTNPDSKKNVKIRVPGMKSFEEFGKGLGFSVTPLPASEIFTSLQTGVIEGTVGGGTELYYNEYRELGKFVMPIRTHFEAHYLTVNQEIWNKLSKADQDSVLKIAQEFENSAFKQAEEEDKKYDELIEGEGIEVYDFTDEEIKAYADKVRKEVWPKIEDQYGDIFEEVKSELGID
ncbi:TRAP transporter substrate-binding protein DctP [Cytobacillus firmus]|uniref:TRAP transporter substrate-binding protein DctP n=1 Tax=Cytobacillus firmus TaxID=1399 RepID=UPI002493D8D8|nr:TRAP transporter substrate-binding protein DctP [Cytobacillus firmus]